MSWNHEYRDGREDGGNEERDAILVYLKAEAASLLPGARTGFHPDDLILVRAEVLGLILRIEAGEHRNVCGA